MESQWYWERVGETHGPVTTDELESLIRLHKIRETDRIRLDGSEEWLSTIDVRTMFESSGAGGSNSPAASATRALAERRRMHLSVDEVPVDYDVSSYLSLPWRVLKGIGWGCGYVLSEILDRIPIPRLKRGRDNAPRESALTTCRNALDNASEWGWIQTLIRHKVALFSILALILTSIVVKEVVFADFDNQRAFAQLSAIGNQIERLQGVMPPEVREKQLATVTALRADLESKARNAPWDRNRYWTASGFRRATVRYKLIKACEILESLFSSNADPEHLKRVFAGQLESTDQLMGQNKAAQSNLIQSIDPMIAGVVIVDGLALGGFVVWWRRRARK